MFKFKKTQLLLYAVEMTKFVQRQSEACFKISYFSEHNANLKYVLGWHMFQNVTQRTHKCDARLGNSIEGLHKDTLLIFGLHDAVRTYTRTILPHSLVSFLYSAVWRKNNKIRCYLGLTSLGLQDLKFQPSVCTNILVTRL